MSHYHILALLYVIRVCTHSYSLRLEYIFVSSSLPGNSIMQVCLPVTLPTTWSSALSLVYRDTRLSLVPIRTSFLSISYYPIASSGDSLFTESVRATRLEEALQFTRSELHRERQNSADSVQRLQRQLRILAAHQSEDLVCLLRFVPWPAPCLTG